jgi:hypothetical protein
MEQHMKRFAGLALFAAVSSGCMTGEVPTSPAIAALNKVSTTTVAFSATIKGPMTLPIGCGAGVTVCGNAKIAGLGGARFNYTITSFQPLGGSCGAYTASVDFTLSDGSTLVVDEDGTVCGPGRSFFPQPGPLGSYGNPVYGEGTWVVVSATGHFSGVTGTGTSWFHNAGAGLQGVYVSSGS